ncbi:MAG: hypothetical protein ACKOUM_12230, partial [Sphingopyxis sp.]
MEQADHAVAPAIGGADMQRVRARMGGVDAPWGLRAGLIGRATGAIPWAALWRAIIGDNGVIRFIIAFLVVVAAAAA